MVLAEPRNPAFDPATSVKVFSYGHNEGDAEATFWFGRALRVGWGCDRKDKYGWALIQAAAAKRVRRALFEMGHFHEFGDSNYPFAVVCYEAVCKADAGDELEWIDEFELHSVRRNHAWRTFQANLVDTLTKPVSLEFAGQAFLVGAASTVGVSSTLSHYSCLLIAMPVAGLVVAFYSVIFTVLACVVPGLDRRDKVVMEMYTAKKNACNSLVERRRGPDGFCRRSAVCSFFLSLIDCSAWCPDTVRDAFYFFFTILVPVMFVVIWCVVLAEEVRENDNHDWWPFSMSNPGI